MQRIFGIVLILLGTLMLAYQGIRYTTTKRIADVGPVHVEKDEKKTIPLPPIVGGVTLGAGIVLVAAQASKN